MNDHCDLWVCPYPRAEFQKPGTHWTCPNCGTEYRLTRPRKERWWRNWYAPHGHWVLAHPLERLAP